MSDFTHDFIVYYKDTFFVVERVDPQRYSHINLLEHVSGVGVFGDTNGGHFIKLA
jgi:hypothetical protein